MFTLLSFGSYHSGRVNLAYAKTQLRRFDIMQANVVHLLFRLYMKLRSEEIDPAYWMQFLMKSAFEWRGANMVSTKPTLYQDAFSFMWRY